MSSAQHPIDLMPQSMRARTEARLAASRTIGLVVIVVASLAALYTHARYLHSSARKTLEIVKVEAAELAAQEARAERAREELKELDEAADLYHRIETPVPFSRILATVVDEMPASMTIDEVYVDADQSRMSRRGRGSRRGPVEEMPRVLVAEISGFAEDDREIADFVRRLQSHAPFDYVNLDYTRQREVRGRTAREFRVSFSIDFEKQYVFVDPDTSSEEHAHVE